MRIWCKLFKKNRMLRDTVIENYDMDLSRTAKVYDSLEQACYEFDLEKPIWLDKINRSSSATPEHGSIRIILSSRLTLIIWIFR